MQVVYKFQTLCQFELYFSVNALAFVATQQMSAVLLKKVDNVQSTGIKNIIKPECSKKCHMLLIFNN